MAPIPLMTALVHVLFCPNPFRRLGATFTISVNGTNNLTLKPERQSVRCSTAVCDRYSGTLIVDVWYSSTSVILGVLVKRALCNRNNGCQPSNNVHKDNAIISIHNRFELTFGRFFQHDWHGIPDVRRTR